MAEQKGSQLVRCLALVDCLLWVGRHDGRVTVGAVYPRFSGESLDEILLTLVLAFARGRPPAGLGQRSLALGPPDRTGHRNAQPGLDRPKAPGAVHRPVRLLRPL